MSVIFPPTILGPEMAAPILWAPGIFGSFCWKTPNRGGGVLGFCRRGGGGSANFIFMGAGIFLKSYILRELGSYFLGDVPKP